MELGRPVWLSGGTVSLAPPLDGVRSLCRGFEVKALLGFPVLAMAMLSSAVTFSKVLLLESPFNSTSWEFSG
uniref:Uncharacterized protein n=1 Tax=Oryza barthii TaxID=65489 RepID=A0A0D3FUP4_9ORYZ